MQMMQKSVRGVAVSRRGAATARPAVSRRCVRVNASASTDANLGFKTMRDGVKVAGDETVLTPRFYTTDFDEMEQLFSLEKNPDLNMAEIDAVLAEFKQVGTASTQNHDTHQKYLGTSRN